MADYTVEVSIPTVGPQGPQGPPGEFGELEAPQDGVIYGRKDGEWVDMTSPANLQVRRGTAAEVAAITPLEGEPVWATDSKVLTVGDGATLGGVPVGLYDTSAYVICRPGDDFADKYAAAKTLTPNGAAKSATNRATLIVFPGTYTVAPSPDINIDGEFVDIFGLAAVRKSRGCLPSVLIKKPLTSQGVLNVTANDVTIFGIKTGLFSIDSNKPLQTFECCLGTGIGCWQAALVAGTFINCQGASEAFAGGGSNHNASGTFVNCTGSFGGGFGAGQGGIASGTFINCSGVFGSATCSGTFWHCEGNFAPSGNLSGKLYYCRKTSGTTFKALTAPGAIRFCIDGSGNAQADLNP